MDKEQLKSQLSRKEDALNESYYRLEETQKAIEKLKAQLNDFPQESDEYVSITGTIYLLGVSERTIRGQIQDFEASIAEIESQMKALEEEQAK